MSSYLYLSDLSLSGVSAPWANQGSRALTPIAGRSRDYAGAAFAEADRNVPLVIGAALENNFVVILDVATALAVRQSKWLGVLHEAATAFVGRARYRAAANKISRLQVAAVACMVGDHLCKGPIRVSKVGGNNASPSLARLAHPACLDVGLELDVHPALGLVRF